MDMSLALPLHQNCGQTGSFLQHDAHPNLHWLVAGPPMTVFFTALWV